MDRSRTRDVRSTPDMPDTPGQPRGVVDTRVMHQVHRRATSLLASAAGNPAAPDAALARLRGFVVAQIHHHHESEDDDLWPLLLAADPRLSAGLAELSTDHDRLSGALDELADVPVGAGDDRAALARAAAAVRDVVHSHLDQEEPLLLPAVAEHVDDDAWDRFARTVIATAPQDGIDLMIGLLHEVGTPAEVETVLRPLPDEAQAALPALRAQGKATLSALRGSG